MVRRDGIVKVLDFGLAKLTERPATTDTEAPTKALVNTGAGAVIGTVAYMSPEQARGLEVDAHTDLWSLGVVLYEMITGRLPFEGQTANDIIASILEKEPPPLARYSREAPTELEWIVTKALTKDKDERYQTAREMLVDLRRLRQRLDVEAEIERTHAPEAASMAAATMSSERSASTAQASVVQTTNADGSHSTSSAEYIITEIKRHRQGALLVLAALAAVSVAAVTYFSHLHSSSQAITSVAVLPFANTAGGAEMEYLSDGISESLINGLSQLPRLKVIARSSSFKYKGKEVDPQEVAKALGVQALVSGRVVQLGDQLQIRAELVDAREGTQLWGEQYSRRASDLLSVQSEISREIAEKLRLRLTAGERQQLAKRETANPQAYELLLKGRFYLNEAGSDRLGKAVDYFQQAIALDPGYGPAYAELSATYGSLVINSLIDPKEGRRRAEEMAQKALELDDSLAEAHLALAILKRDAWDWSAAERDFKRAIELNPNLARAHLAYSLYLANMGRHDEAIAESNRARELDPLSPRNNSHVGYRLYFARRYDEAVESLQKTLELNQSYDLTHVILGYAYSTKGMPAEAIREYREAIRLGDDSPSTQIYLGAAFAQAGERQQSRAILKRLESGERYVSPCELAILYSALDEQEKAFASLERAYVARDVQLQFLGADPHFDSLRADQRFQDLMRRVGLPQ
jgi:TolB-like protein/Flp pilus assembly protein TadD